MTLDAIPARGQYSAPLVSPFWEAHQAERVRFVLVDPTSPGNVGAVCRAIKTMGFRNLSVVGGPDSLLDHAEARRLAHKAEDVLEGIDRVASLREGLEGLNFVVGTTHRARAGQFSAPLPVRTAAQGTARRVIMGHQKVGILFGSEGRGLTDAELVFCQETWTIPAAIAQPSLNLAQAVQIVAYEMHLAAQDFQPARQNAPPSLPRTGLLASDLAGLVEHLDGTLLRLGFANRHAEPARFRASLSRMLSRGDFERRDIRLLHRVLQQLDRFVAVQASRNIGGGGDSNSRDLPSG